MRFADNPERQRILHQALWATTAPEIEQATQELDGWVNDHPNDLGILDAYEVLANMQEIAEAQDAERAAPALTGYAA